MDNKVNLTRQVFDKNTFKKTIDTEFKQLVTNNNPSNLDLNLVTVDDFFILYNKLFYSIPKEGENDSHQFLINTSQTYVGSTKINEEIQALLQEIAELRQEILDMQIGNSNQ